MLVITGAAGFIGSYLAGYLNRRGYREIILVDDFSRSDKMFNLQRKQNIGLVHRNYFHDWLATHQRQVTYIFHLGARTDTTERNVQIFDSLNLEYSKMLWHLCAKYDIPLLYASSAATYGRGDEGYLDDHAKINTLLPLNPYGQSKQDFDLWVLEQPRQPSHWLGLKFFNVYGPNEYHKGRMASVIFHAYNQILNTGKMKLFRSHRRGIADGHQSRDFIYVEDIAAICTYCLTTRPVSGIYNAGTGEARTFLDLVNETFAAMELEPAISYIDTPLDIRENYQYFTQADMNKLALQGFNQPFTSLESGVEKYVREYLSHHNYY